MVMNKQRTRSLWMMKYQTKKKFMSHNNAVNNLFLSQTVNGVAADYTVVPDDVFLSVDTSAPRFITLPSPSIANQGQFYIIKDSSGDAATHNMTIKSASGLIDKDPTTVCSSNYGSIELYSNGTNYLSMNRLNPIKSPITYASGGWAKYSAKPFVPGSTVVAKKAATDTPLPDTARWDLSALPIVTPLVKLGSNAQTITFKQSGWYHIIAQAVVITSSDVDPLLQLVKNRQTVTCSFITSAHIISPATSDYQGLQIFYTDNYEQGDSIDFRSGTWQLEESYQFCLMSCFVQQLPITSIP